MKKKLLLVIILLLPFIVEAETLNYEVCKNGCEYTELNDVYNVLKELDLSKTYDINIEVKDGETYVVNSSSVRLFNSSQEIIKSSITIKGTGSTRPTIKTDSDTEWLPNYSVWNLDYENINFEVNDMMLGTNTYVTNGHTNLKNCDIKGNYVSILGYKVSLDNVKYDGKVLFLISDTNSTINNSTINVTGNYDNYEYSLREDRNLTIKNSTVNAGTYLMVEELYLEDTQINGNIEGHYRQEYNNSKIDGKAHFKVLNFDLNNVEITKGLDVSRTYCSNYEWENDRVEDSTITDSKISNPEGTAFFMGVRDIKTLTIENTDFSNSKISIVSHIPQPELCPLANHNSKVYPTYLENVISKNIEISVYKSIVNGAYTLSDYPDVKAFNMYFAADNTWVKEINRGNDLDTSNVIGLNAGNVVIEHALTKNINLKDGKQDITKLFEDIASDINWSVENDKILKIEDGKIVPLKAGTTKITGEKDNDAYVLTITVLDEQENPNTKDIVIAIIACAITAIFIFIVVYDKYKTQKI